MRRLPFLLGFFLVWAPCIPSLSEGQTPAPKKQARRHFEEGKKLFQVGRFRDAIAEFEKSYLLYKAPEILFMIGQCHNQLGDYRRAVHFYKTFLGEKPNAKNREDIEAMIAELEKKIQASEEMRAHPPSHSPPPSAPPSGDSGKSPLAPHRPSQAVQAPKVQQQGSSHPHAAHTIEPKGHAKQETGSSQTKPKQGRLIEAGTARSTQSGPTQRDSRGLSLTLSTQTPGAAGVQAQGSMHKPSPFDEGVVGKRTTQKTPFYRTWWFWTGTAALVLTTVITVVAVSAQGGPPKGSVGTLDCTDPNRGCVVLTISPWVR